MKKNVMMRVASALLVAVLLTTCAISGTFAKYTTQDKAEDTARVAKWGVELQVVGNLYGETYKDSIIADDDASMTVHVKDYASVEDNVVAPGTENLKGLSFKLNGTPEVSGTITTKISYENIYLKNGTYGIMVKIDGVVTAENFVSLGTVYTYDDVDKTYTADNTFDGGETYYTLEDSVTFAEDYYPVEYAMAGTLTNYNTGYDKTLNTNTIKGVVEALIADGRLGTADGADTVLDGKVTNTWKKSFAVNQNLDDEVAKLGDQKITWKWDYENNDVECSGDNSCNFCKADTILGNLADGNVAVVKEISSGVFKAPTVAQGNATEYDYNLETSFSIDITVTQAD